MDSFFDTELFSYGSLRITVFSIVMVIATILAARIIVAILKRVLSQFFQRKEIESGRQVAVFQIAKYLIYLFAFLVVLKAIGVGLTGLMVGSGALLVGIGFGLQQTFNDFLSGLILLFEGGVKVGDDLDIDGMFGHVERIGLRTTEVLTLDDIRIIIPNSHLVSNSVTNWSHNKRPARFHINVGVPYASDIDVIERLLLEAADEQHSIRKSPSPVVHLVQYGDSSVDFKLHFYSREFRLIQKVRSDLRKRVFKKLRENGIEIPFPQRDVWMRESN